MPNVTRRIDPPLTVEREERLAAPGLPAEQFRQLINAPGSWNSCDVWFQVPADQAGTALRLYAINGSIKVPIQPQRTFNDATGVWKDAAGNRWSGLIYSVRSRPCDGFLLEFAPSGAVQNAEPTRFRMECWWDCGPYSDQAGIISVDPWNIGDPNGPNVIRYRTPPTGLITGTTVLTPPPGPGGRWDLIYASVYTDSVNPQPVTFQTRDFGPPLVVANMINVVLQNFSSPWTYEGSGWPGGGNGQWEVVATAPPGPAVLHVLAEWRLND